ncbi:hypothetical protein A33Q_1893 [Indibacter alkaliphilus LW1]|uniref:Uncharacterized protein n=1 Tax=Indibacter alkaliphilus (strain CCUG 57479 / KCTC 22604 / LW1) TaxID=1189612 RepID=S2DIE9_INDAL|nr:hypothetical protein [Indibacter alkaliphilus]EOZ96975.1 hypothetical protein A33Q_1893 [Indibacter alkaliphilus LW1]
MKAYGLFFIVLISCTGKVELTHEESELKKVTQENFLRVFEAVGQKAAELQKVEQPRIAKILSD